MMEPCLKDEVYGPHERNRFDLWLAASDKPTPLIVNFHGGGFMGGDKSGIKEGIHLEPWVNAGISVASVNYRLTDTAPYPAQMLDAARAVQTLRHRAKQWNIDPVRVGACGGSAGAGISLWLAFHDDLADPEAEDPVSRQSTRLKCAFVWSAQCTYDPRDMKKIIPGMAYDHAALKRLFGLPDDWNWDKEPISDDLDALMKDCAPITHLSSGAPPVFAIYQQKLNKDGDVHHFNMGKHLKAAMDKVGVECTIRLDTEYENGEDGDVADSLSFFGKYLEVRN